MKKLLTVIATATIFLTACTHNKQDTVDDFLSASNKFDKEKVSQLLADNFFSVDKDGNKTDKTAFLNQLDTLKNLELTSTIVSVQDLDSIIKTEERSVSILDSLLEVTPKLFQRKTYKVKEGKIVSMVVDTTLNYDDYKKSFNEKLYPFSFWVEDTHDVEEQKQILQNLKKYLTEYSQISVADKKKYRTYSRLQGTYISKDNPFYRKIVFKGKTTVVIVDAIFGFQFPSSYVLDEGYIRIRTDKSDLLLQITDNNTLTGEGFAAGTFTKVN